MFYIVQLYLRVQYTQYKESEVDMSSQKKSEILQYRYGKAWKVKIKQVVPNTYNRL